MILGIIHKDGKIINHRSLFKVIFNPIFRRFGFQVGTPYNTLTDELEGIFQFMKCPKRKIKWEKYYLQDYVVEKRRRLV